jgi:hypothetical protein
MLAGKKTYLTAAAMGVAAFLRGLGWLDQQQYELVLGLLGSLGLATLRAGVSKL